MIPPHPRQIAELLLKKVTLRRAGKWLLLMGLIGLLVVAGVLLNRELQSSTWQARYLSELGRELTFKPAPGPSPSIQFPQSGPYDERLGYSQIPAFAQLLTTHGYQITQQARLSPRLATLTQRGIARCWPA